MLGGSGDNGFVFPLKAFRVKFKPPDVTAVTTATFTNVEKTF